MFDLCPDTPRGRGDDEEDIDAFSGNDSDDMDDDPVAHGVMNGTLPDLLFKLIEFPII